jgi:BirA family biotin operon repressor/biotin-[acetyl-CoA-carboxylase] ligase
MSMADASEAVASLADGVVRLKWPNDLVIEFDDAQGIPRAPQPGTEATSPTARVRKLAGVLGETVGLGTSQPTAIIGIGVNVDWRRDDFPPDLAAAMTSLSHASGRHQSREDLLGAFLARLEHDIDDLRHARFDDDRWQDRQVTTGRSIDLIYPDDRRTTLMALGVDPRSGGLIVEDEGRTRIVHSAEILHVRLSAQRLPTEVGV